MVIEGEQRKLPSLSYIKECTKPVCGEHQINIYPGCKEIGQIQYVNCPILTTRERYRNTMLLNGQK